MGFKLRKGSGSRRPVRNLRAFRPGMDWLPVRELLSGVPVAAGYVSIASGGGQFSAGGVNYDLNPNGTLCQVGTGTQVLVKQGVSAAEAQGGYVYELLGNGQLFQNSIGTNHSILLEHNVSQIRINGSGTLFYIDSSTNSLHSYTPVAGSTLIAGDTGQIDVDKTGTLYYLNFATHALFNYVPGSGSTLIAGNVGQMGVDGSETLYFLNSVSHELSEFQPGIGSTLIAGNVGPMGVAGSGTLYFLNSVRP